MKSKYINIAELLPKALVVRVAGLLSERRYVPNVNSKYFIIAELSHNALVVIFRTGIVTKKS